MVDKTREKLKRVLKWIHKIIKKYKIDQISSRGLFNANGSMVLPLEVRNVSLALRIASLFEVISLRGTSCMLSLEWTERVKLNSSLHLLLSLGIPLKGQMGALHVLIRYRT